MLIPVSNGNKMVREGRCFRDQVGCARTFSINSDDFKTWPKQVHIQKGLCV